MPFRSDLNTSDILENFEFEQFLQTTGRNFDIDPSTFEAGDGIETGGDPNLRERFDLEQSSRKNSSSQSGSAVRFTKKVKEDHDETIKTRKRERRTSSRFAVDEAHRKKSAWASLMEPDDRNMSPSLGGIISLMEPIDRPLEKKPLLPPKDLKTLRKEPTELPTRADQPATASRPQLPPIQGLGLAINIMPPQKDKSSVRLPPPRTYHPHTMYSYAPALAMAEPRETEGVATSLEDPDTIIDSVLKRERVELRQHQNEQSESRLADMEVADRLVLLWTTVKPL